MVNYSNNVFCNESDSSLIVRLSENFLSAYDTLTKNRMWCCNNSMRGLRNNYEYRYLTDGFIIKNGLFDYLYSDRKGVEFDSVYHDWDCRYCCTSDKLFSYFQICKVYEGDTAIQEQKNVEYGLLYNDSIIIFDYSIVKILVPRDSIPSNLLDSMEIHRMTYTNPTLMKINDSMEVYLDRRNPTWENKAYSLKDLYYVNKKHEKHVNELRSFFSVWIDTMKKYGLEYVRSEKIVPFPKLYKWINLKSSR